MSVKTFWDRVFLAERPSIGLAFFRLAVGFTVAAHMIPTLFHLKDNYLSAGFKEKNSSFFTPEILALIEQSPDGLVIFMAIFFLAALTLFTAGLFTQSSCILMTLGCYYFYGLNSLHIGTLSFDILLVTLFLMCVSPYPGDFFSLDAIRRADLEAYKRRRPFFVQRLLQLQIASTFFYTALYKFTAQGNWLTQNPIHYLLNSRPESVVKHFPLREFFARSPEICYVIGILIILTELALPFLLFWRRTRVAAIVVGFLFHVMLVVTLHVPTIFFFLFPPQLLLFIEPEKIVAWIDQRRQKNMDRGQDSMIYDGHCHFCVMSMRRLATLDATAKIKHVDYQPFEDISKLDPRLTREKCHSVIHLLTKDGQLFGGFSAFRALTLRLPLLYLFAPILHLPGMKWVGDAVYAFIAKNRYLFHRKAACQDNACLR